MNGKDKEDIQDTFRHELELVFEPVRETLTTVNATLVKHGEDIRENKTKIKGLKEKGLEEGTAKRTVSSWLVALAVATPTVILAIIAVLNYWKG